MLKNSLVSCFFPSSSPQTPSLWWKKYCPALWCFRCFSHGILMVYTLTKSRIILQTASFLHQQRLKKGRNYIKFSKPTEMNTAWAFNLWKQDRRIGNNCHTCSWCFSTYTHQSVCLFWQALSKKWPSKHRRCHSFLSHFFGPLRTSDVQMCLCLVGLSSQATPPASRT